MEYVTSLDGTRIAYEVSGSGPPLVLVHGSLNDRNAWGMVLPAFRERFTVYAIDRRGRGESGPPTEHALERQFEDIVAVIEAAGEPVDLVGHSYGAHCALGAAALVPQRVKHLVLYEPPTPGPVRLDVAEAFAGDDPSAAVATFMGWIGLTPEQVEALKATPFWTYLLRFTPTMPVEGRALVEYGFDPQRLLHLKMPALFLVGSQTDAQLGDVLRRLRPVMPQAEWTVFEGHGHAATMTAPQLFAETVISFLTR
jgi:pimeloyl-ACP methyl ester carboxylesterase